MSRHLFVDAGYTFHSRPRFCGNCHRRRTGNLHSDWLQGNGCLRIPPWARLAGAGMPRSRRGGLSGARRHGRLYRCSLHHRVSDCLRRSGLAWSAIGWRNGTGSRGDRGDRCGRCAIGQGKRRNGDCYCRHGGEGGLLPCRGGGYRDRLQHFRFCGRGHGRDMPTTSGRSTSCTTNLPYIQQFGCA